jgi:hypothetical protein
VGDEVIGCGAAGDEGGLKAGIEGGEAPAVLYGEAEEVEIGEVPGSGESRKLVGVAKREIIRQELMAGRRAVLKQEATGEFRRAWPIRVAGPAKDADESIFDERTGRPAFALRRGKKPRA